MKEVISAGEIRVNWARAREEGNRSYVEHKLTERISVAFAESDNGTGVVGIPLDLRESIPDNVTGEGLEIGRSFFELGGSRQSCLVLTCGDAGLERVFSEFVAALLERIHEGFAPIPAISDSVREYRALLRRHHSGTVTRETAMGLAGELLTLGKMKTAFDSAWQAWNGPLGQTHDFVSGSVAIEVKTTSHEAEPSFEVANALQLYPSDGGELFLVHHVLVPNPQGQVTVSTLAAGIREQLTDPTGFDKRLEAMNFDRSAPEVWDQFVFQLTHSAMYRVEDGFPRIPRDIVDQVPNGVSNIRYRVHLSQAAAFRISDPSETDNVYAKMEIVGGV